MSSSAHLSSPQIQYIMVAHESKNYSVERRDPLESLLSLWESRSVVSNSLWPHGLHRLYNPWNSPGQNMGVGNLSFLKGIFPTQGLNQGLSCHWSMTILKLSREFLHNALIGSWVLVIILCGYWFRPLGSRFCSLRHPSLPRKADSSIAFSDFFLPIKFGVQSPLHFILSFSFSAQAGDGFANTILFS